MIYIRKFPNNNKIDEYKKSNFISPHLFFDSNERKVKFFEKYQRLDYISSTATGGQYIDLGCHLMENTDDIKIDIKFNIKGEGKSSSGNDSKLGTLIGSQPEVSPWPGFVLRRNDIQQNNITLQAKWKFTNSFQQSGTNKFHSKCLTDSSGGLLKWKRIYEFSETLDNIPQSQVSNTPCTLFCAYDGNGNPFRFTLADLYYLKITKGGKVIRNLIPVRKLSTNEVGLYDIENDHLYVSQGDEPFEGDFIYDHEIEYLESTGKQWVELDNAVFNHGLRGEIVMQNLYERNDEKCIIGRNNGGGFNIKICNTGKISLWVQDVNDGITLSSDDVLSFNKDIQHIIFNIRNDNVLYLKVDNDEYTMSYSKKDAGTSKIQLFTHRSNSMNNNATARIYSCKLWYNDTMIFDLIPVRKHGIGYMYDKLTGMLFSNSPNSIKPFILGPDI